MNRYLKQYVEAKNDGCLDEQGDPVLINPRGFPAAPSFWLKIEFLIAGFFWRCKSSCRDFAERILEI